MSDTLGYFFGHVIKFIMNNKQKSAEFGFYMPKFSLRLLKTLFAAYQNTELAFLSQNAYFIFAQFCILAAIQTSSLLELASLIWKWPFRSFFIKSIASLR